MFEGCLSVVDFCLNSTYFIFNSDIFKQIFGTALGSSIHHHTVVNIVIKFLEKSVLNALVTIENINKKFNEFRAKLHFTDG